jgi:hypothetical protein
MSRRWLLCVVLAAAACARRTPGTPSEAGEADASFDGGPEAPGADAVCKAPTACNDDPTSPMVAGACSYFPAAAPWFSCACADGFSVNFKTGLCRAGNVCMAAGSDAWPLSMPFDTSDCATRVTTRCAQLDGGPDASLATALTTLMGSTCRQPELLTVRVEVVDGCPTVFEASFLGSKTPPTGMFVACFSPLLAHLRLDCVPSTACFMAEHDTLP